MAHHLLATCLVSSFLSTQVCIRAQQFNEGKEWNVNYTVKHVSPHRRAYIYRTFRDVPENKLVVFAELAEYAVDELSHCNVQPFRHSSFLLPAKVTKLPFRHWGSRVLGQHTWALEEFIPIRVECDLGGGKDFKYAAVSLRAGDQPFLGVGEVVDIPKQRAGTLAACVGPLVSGALSQEWVRHHQGLGVEKFFGFVPGGREYTDGKYNANGDIPENILDYLHWSGTFRPEAVTLTPRASVEYLPYAPPATSFYFGQFAMMHACWYMQRYAYDFVLYVDTDEYVWLESSVMGRPKPLLAWLGTVPAKAATVTLHRFTYPPACQPSGAHAPMVERAVVRQEDAHQHSKMLVRPRDLLLATNHVPVDVRDGFEESYDAVDEVRLKHIRDENFRYPGIFDCTDARLVQDPPHWRAVQHPPTWR